EDAPALGRERRGLRLEVVHGDAELVAVAPGARDVDRIGVADGAVAVRLGRVRGDAVRVRAALTRSEEIAAVARHERAREELVGAVAAELPARRDAVTDRERVGTPAEPTERRDARHLQLPVL